jgi:hypothetical protein
VLSERELAARLLPTIDPANVPPDPDNEYPARLAKTIINSEFIDQLIEELNDTGPRGKTHYSISAYTDGCRGPLCTLHSRHKYLYKKYGQAQEYGGFTPADAILGTFASRLLAEQGRDFPICLLWVMDRLGISMPETVQTPGEKLFARVASFDDRFAIRIASHEWFEAGSPVPGY